MTPQERIARKYANRTDLTNQLSYANGQKNMLQLAATKYDIKLRIINSTSNDKKVLLAPAHVRGKDLGALSAENVKTYLEALGITLADGTDVVFKAATTPAADTLSIQSLNSDQDRNVVFEEIGNMPTQIQGISLRSYTANGVPEDGNYSNQITRHIVSSLFPRKYKTLSLGEFQTSSDVTTNIVKVDFVKENFVCKLSQNDLFELKVNANTRIDITLHLGARDSREERFHRQVEAGMEMLREEFPTQFARNRFN